MTVDRRIQCARPGYRELRENGVLLEGNNRNIDAPIECNYFVVMKASLVRIGNSRGIRLPKPVIEQCGFEQEVEMLVQDHQLVIRSSTHPRTGWASAFAQMSEFGEDKLLDRVADTGTAWEAEEWEW
jgi:antitoxin MazE